MAFFSLGSIMTWAVAWFWVVSACSPHDEQADVQGRRDLTPEEYKRWAKSFRDLEKQLRPPFDYFCRVVPGATDFDEAVARD